MALRGGPTEQCRSEGMPSLSEAPSGGAEAFWLLLRFSKVTRRQGGTLSRRHRSNGYTHHPIPKKSLKKAKKRRFPFLKKHRFLVTNTKHKAGLFHSRENQNSGVYFTENIRLRGSPKLL